MTNEAYLMSHSKHRNISETEKKVIGSNLDLYSDNAGLIINSTKQLEMTIYAGCTSVAQLLGQLDLHQPGHKEWIHQ